MPSKKQTRKKTKSSPTRRLHKRLSESDSTYFLKLVVVLLIGTFWLKFDAPAMWVGVTYTALPLGLLMGLLMVRAFEHRQEDRKIWYAVLLVVTIVSYFLPAGIVI